MEFKLYVLNSALNNVLTNTSFGRNVMDVVGSCAFQILVAMYQTIRYHNSKDPSTNVHLCHYSKLNVTDDGLLRKTSVDSL